MKVNKAFKLFFFDTRKQQKKNKQALSEIFFKPQHKCTEVSIPYFKFNTFFSCCAPSSSKNIQSQGNDQQNGKWA